MSLGIVSDEDFLKEIERMEKSPIPSNPLPVIKDINTPGRRPGDIETPEVLRKLIGDTHLTEGRAEALELSRALGVSDSQESSYAKGLTSPRGNPNNPLNGYLTKRRKNIAVKASKLAVNALNSITDDKLNESSATELAAIAKSAAAIVKDMLPEDKSKSDGNSPAVQFIIHAPQITREEKFNVIDVRATEELQ